MSREKRTKDSNMAALMKKMGVERKYGNCPMCHRTVPLSKMQNHIITCR